MKLWLPLILIFLSAQISEAATKIGDLYYELYSSKTATVTYEKMNNKANYQNLPFTDIVIDSELEYSGETYIINTIGPSAFYYAPLTSIVIPETIETIRERAFQYCTSLTVITVRKVTPPTISASTTFSDETYQNAVLYVPKGSVELYRQTPYWQKFMNIEEIPTILLGDSNDSGSVTVADVTTTANYIINLPVAKWNFENADVNADNKISTADVTGTLDIILNESDSYHLRRTRRDAAEEMSDRLISDNYVSGDSQAMIGVRLEGSRPYSALQASLIVPEGMKVKDIEGGPRLSDHTLLFNEAAPGVVKIIIFSFTNTEFNSEDTPLFYIVADTRNAEGDLRIEDVFASDAGSNEYELGFEGGVNETLTTGIVPMNVEAVIIHTVADGIEILNAEGQAINVYRFTGETVATVPQASSFEEVKLPPGMYIVKVGNSAAKVIVK